MCLWVSVYTREKPSQSESWEAHSCFCVCSGPVQSVWELRIGVDNILVPGSLCVVEGCAQDPVEGSISVQASPKLLGEIQVKSLAQLAHTRTCDRKPVKIQRTTFLNLPEETGSFIKTWVPGTELRSSNLCGQLSYLTRFFEKGQIQTVSPRPKSWIQILLRFLKGIESEILFLKPPILTTSYTLSYLSVHSSPQHF